MHCTLCGATGRSFVKASHARFGIVYLCGECAQAEERHLRPAERSCDCDPDAVR